MTKIISSLSNDNIKQLSKLNNKKNILNQQRLLVEGEKVIKTLLQNNDWKLVELLVVENKIQHFSELIKLANIKNINSIYISESVANKLADTISTSGIFAVVDLSNKHESIIQSQKILVLDNMQNPSNLGALIRSALAFGYNQIIMIDGVYAYLPKVVRSSMGYVFDIDIIQMTKQEFLKFASSSKYSFVVADMNGVELSEFKSSFNKNKHIGIILGNEGAGVSDDLQAISKHTVSIPMLNNVESLNVSISGAIIMYELKANNK